jgi:hypothetical protein
MHLLDHVASVRQWLCEVADGAHDIFVAVYAERDDGDEAEREPRVALDDRRGPVTLEYMVSRARRTESGSVQHVRSCGIGIADLRRL